MSVRRVGQSLMHAQCRLCIVQSALQICTIRSAGLRAQHRCSSTHFYFILTHIHIPYLEVQQYWKIHWKCRNTTIRNAHSSISALQKNDIRDVGSTADLVLVFLVHLVHWFERVFVPDYITKYIGHRHIIIIELV